jgi:LuxR family maltose regulon positive regulatory protein
VLGVALLLCGDPSKAVEQFDHVVLLGREQPRVEAALAAAQLSLLAADRDDAEEAELWAAEARRNLAATQNEDRMTAVATLLTSARADLLRGDRESARRGLGRAVRHYFRVPPTAFPWLATQAALVLGNLSLHLGDPHAARVRLDEARRHQARLPTSGVLSDAAHASAVGVARTGDRSAVLSAMALSAAEERVLRLLPTHLSLAEIAEELYVSQHGQDPGRSDLPEAAGDHPGRSGRGRA